MSVRVVAHVAGWWLPDPSASLLPRRDDVLDFGVPGRSAKNGDDVLVVRKGAGQDAARARRGSSQPDRNRTINCDGGKERREHRRTERQCWSAHPRCMPRMSTGEVIGRGPVKMIPWSNNRASQPIRRRCTASPARRPELRVLVIISFTVCSVLCTTCSQRLGPYRTWCRVRRGTLPLRRPFPRLCSSCRGLLMLHKGTRGTLHWQRMNGIVSVSGQAFSLLRACARRNHALRRPGQYFVNPRPTWNGAVWA